MSCGINSFKNRITVNQSVKVEDGSGGFELNSTLLLTVWSMVEATEEKPEEIDEGRNTRSVWYDVTTRLSPMLDTLHRLNSLFFVVDGGKSIYPKSYKIKGNLVTFKAAYNYDDSVIPVYVPVTMQIQWDGSTNPEKNTFVDANDTEILTYIDTIFDVTNLSTSFMWHKFTRATSTQDGTTDRVITSADQLTNRVSNLEGSSVSGALISINNNQESFNMSSASIIIRNDSQVGGTFFSAPFSVWIPFKALDGQPSATSFILHDQGASTSYRFYVAVQSTGKLNVAFVINGVAKQATTSTAVFANGAQNDFLGVAITVSDSQISIYTIGRDLVITNHTLDAVQNGDLTGVLLANYINTTNKLRVGANSTSNLNANLAHYGELIIQDIVWTSANIVSIATQFFAASYITPINVLAIGDSLMNGSTNGTATAAAKTLFESSRTGGIASVVEVSDMADTGTGTCFPSMASKFKSLINKELVVVEQAFAGSNFSPDGDNNNYSVTGDNYGLMQLDADEYLTTQNVASFDFIYIILGINDVVADTLLTTVETDAVSLITRLRADYGTSTPILICQLGRHPDVGYASDPFWLGVKDIISNGVDGLVETYSNVYQVADLINDYGEAAFHDGLHLDQTNTNKLGEDVATYYINNFV